jgi:hypothetical protein
VTAPPGGRLEGFSDAVAPSGTPCTASRIGLASAVPCGVTEKLNVAALPAGTDSLVTPVPASVKSDDGAPTATLTTADVLARKFVSPPYTALKACVPVASELVLKVAAPAPESGTALNAVVPSITVTEPVGAPLVVLAACTFSVNGRPAPMLPAEADTTTVDGAFAMLTATGAMITV